jgi:hypothetical protein
VPPPPPSPAVRDRRSTVGEGANEEGTPSADRGGVNTVADQGGAGTGVGPVVRSMCCNAPVCGPHKKEPVRHGKSSV